MKVSLLHHTPLSVCADAIRQCWDTKDKSDTGKHICNNCGFTPIPEQEVCPKCDAWCEYDENAIGIKDLALIDRVVNKHMHGSTVEHIVYNFEISGVSRALLQEFARHRIASLTVKSTRFTLKELKKEDPFVTYDGSRVIISPEQQERAYQYILSINEDVDFMSTIALDNLRVLIVKGISNDKAKYCMPESYKTQYHWTINARSLRNFLELRTGKSALKEIRDLAFTIYNELPTSHKFLYNVGT